MTTENTGLNRIGAKEDMVSQSQYVGMTPLAQANWLVQLSDDDLDQFVLNLVDCDRDGLWLLVATLRRRWAEARRLVDRVPKPPTGHNRAFLELMTKGEWNQ